MTEAWKTKYGPRRVRHDPPTLEEAIFAAKGLTDDLQQQVEIAASLMGVAAEKVKAEIMKAGYSRTRPTRLISSDRGKGRAVVVEHRVARRPARAS
ncbi:MAG TPA: hypothetical protein VGH49_18100 [Xanthobacteraceae bacterium]